MMMDLLEKEHSLVRGPKYSVVCLSETNAAVRSVSSLGPSVNDALQHANQNTKEAQPRTRRAIVNRIEPTYQVHSANVKGQSKESAETTLNS
jgi:hypothetical protein